jgi:hypothetical protein
MLAKTFADALRIEQQNDALARERRAQLERTGGVDNYRASLEILPLVTDQEYAALQQMWAKVPAGKFDDTTANQAAIRHGNRQNPAINAPITDVFGQASAITGTTNPLLKGIEAKLRTYHKTLKSLFPCPGEVDPIGVFRDIATKGNFDKSMRREVGPFRDFSLMLIDPGTKEILGGIDFCVYIHKDGPATVQTNFTFLKSENRGNKFMGMLLKAQDEAALKFIQENKPEALKYGGFYGVTEQNIPEALGGKTYIWDKAHSMDPITRLRIWAARKYARLNFRYIQPSLAEGEPRCEFLSLNIAFRRVKKHAGGTFRLGTVERPDGMPTKTLQSHLHAFYTQSIDGVPGDTTAKEIEGSLNQAAARGATITTAPAAEQKAYLDLWERRARQVMEAFLHTRLTDQVTIADLYQQATVPSAQRTSRQAGSRPPPGKPGF